MTFEECTKKLTEMSHLKDGWNSYRAKAPASVARLSAYVFCDWACKMDLSPALVMASAMGGVGVELGEGERQVLVEFYNNGTAHCLFCDDSTERMRTEALPLADEAYLNLLSEAKGYLEGVTDDVR